MGSLVSIYMRELFKLRTFIYNQPFLHHYFLNRLYNNNTSVKIYRSIVTFNISIMSRKNKNQTNIWIAIEAIFLIILLIIWLTVADFTGDTDVAAFIAPAFSGLTFLKL